MDIDLLSKMVAELILDNDEVALPGLGTFVAEEVPSSFSDKGYTINPPYRRLSFRQKVSRDTKLIDFYAYNNHLDSQTAASILQTYLMELKDVLMSRKMVVFPGLGRLRATRENNFFFIPDEDLNIYPDGYGLEPVSLKTHEETEDEVQSVVAGLQSMISADILVADANAAEAQPVSAVKPQAEEAAAPVVAEPAAEPQKEDSAAPAVNEPSVEPRKEDTPVETAPEKPARKRPGWKIAAAVLIAAALLLVLFLILAKVAPDFIDRILYSPEELQIIRNFGK